MSRGIKFVFRPISISDLLKIEIFPKFFCFSLISEFSGES